jgi:hypothetical protein
MMWTDLLVFGLAVNAWVMGGIYMALVYDLRVEGGWREYFQFLVYSAIVGFYSFLLGRMGEIENG